MELILDSKRIEITENENSTLREVIERISLILKDQQRIISEIYVDGVMEGGWDQPSVGERTVGSCQSLRVISEEPRRVAHRVLYDIGEYISKIQHALVDASALIQSRKETQGLELLEQITTTWVELYQGLQSAIIVTGLDLNRIVVEGKTFLEVNQETHSFLEQVSDLIQEQQFLELSDILEYEIAPRMPLIQEGIYQIIKELEKKPN